MCTNIDPIPEADLAGVYTILLRAVCNKLMGYIGKNNRILKKNKRT